MTREGPRFPNEATTVIPAATGWRLLAPVWTDGRVVDHVELSIIAWRTDYSVGDYGDCSADVYVLPITVENCVDGNGLAYLTPDKRVCVPDDRWFESWDTAREYVYAMWQQEEAARIARALARSQQ